MTNKRITEVDFIDSLNSDESFFVNKNNSIKQINKGKIVFDIVNGGTGANNADDARANLNAASNNDVEKIRNEIDEEIKTSIDDVVTNFNEHIAAFNEYADATSNSINQIMNEVKPVSKGGTGASNGAVGLKNLFASGSTILSLYQYGDTLPTDNSPDTVGRIFFKKLSN